MELELSERRVHERALETLRATLEEQERPRHWQAGS